jgi:hypothetical protein
MPLLGSESGKEIHAVYLEIIGFSLEHPCLLGLCPNFQGKRRGISGVEYRISETGARKKI